jgi:5'-nucleotidase
MPYDLTTLLVIGISSRALFNLEEENRIYEEKTLEEYIQYQLDETWS